MEGVFVGREIEKKPESAGDPGLIQFVGATE
jgi:hypothetical protein